MNPSCCGLTLPCEVTLDLHKFGVTATSSVYRIEKAQLQNIGSNLVHSLVTQICGEKQDPFIFSEPESWWQMFKRDVLNRYFRCRFKIKFIDHRVDVTTLYPKLKTKLPPDLMGPIVVVRMHNRVIGSFFTDIEGECCTPQKWNQEVVPTLFKNVRCDGMTCPTCKRTLKHD